MTANALAPTVGRYSAADARQVMDFHNRAVPRILTTVIETTYVQPTGDHGSRFRAMDLGTGDQTYVACDYSLTTPENHLAAAIACIAEWRVAEYRLIHYTVNAKGSGTVWTFAVV